MLIVSAVTAPHVPPVIRQGGVGVGVGAVVAVGVGVGFGVLVGTGAHP